MGVGIKGEPGGEVTEHTADSFDVYVVLQCYGLQGVEEVMESNS